MTDLKKEFLKIKSWNGLEGVADWWLAKLEAARDESRREAQDEIRAWAKAHGKNYKELRDFVDFINDSRNI